MKRTNFGIIIISVITFLLAMSLPGYAQQDKMFKSPTLKKAPRKAPTTRPGKDVVKSAAKKTVSFKAGGDVAIIFVSSGQRFEAGGDTAIIFVGKQLLNRITSAQVIMNNRPVPGVKVRLGPVTAKGRKITLKARSGAKVGDKYQLRLIAGRQVINVPLNVMRMAVKESQLQRIGPQIAPPPGPKIAETMEQRRTRKDAESFTSYELNSIVAQIFSKATFTASACGGSYTYRNTIINIPNLLNNKESLDRLDYELTSGEKESSEWVKKIKYSPDVHYRRSKIRACVDDWKADRWKGGIEGGKLKITMFFDSRGGMRLRIKGRAIDRGRIYGVWSNLWNWNDYKADKALPDYEIRNVKLYVFLTPRVDAGRITYSGLDVRWDYGDWGFRPGKFRLNKLKPKVINYKDDKMETIRQRIRNVFNRPDVRNRLSQAMTDYVMLNPLVNKVVSLSDNGTWLEVGYE